MNFGHYETKLAQVIREVTSDYSETDENIRIISVCFWHQFSGNIISEANRDSSNLWVTKRWILHMWLTPYKIPKDSFRHPTYDKMLSCLTNQWENESISVISTRGSEFNHDLLWSNVSEIILPLAIDQINSKIGIMWVKNGKFISIQWHPEFPITQYEKEYLEWVENIITQAKNTSYMYLSIQEMMENFGFDEKNIQKYVQREVNTAFYVPVILEFLKSITLQLEKKDTQYQSQTPEKIEYSQAIKNLRQQTKQRVNALIEDQDKTFNSRESRQNFLKSLDHSGRLRLNKKLDWKVDRWIDEWSRILWIKNLWNFIKEVRMYHNSKDIHTPFYTLDIWAWDGSMIAELHKELSGYDVIEYWVGDFVYVDLYHILKKDDRLQNIPNKVKIIFVNKVLANLAKWWNLDHLSVLNQLKFWIEKLEFSQKDKLSHGSMFSEETHMFPWEELVELWEEWIQYIQQHSSNIDTLCEYISKHFYDMWNGFTDRIYVSTFYDLENLLSWEIRHPDFQYAIRSTSHVDGKEYAKIMFDAIQWRMQKYWVYLDNWVHRSYTSIPRIPELYKVRRKFSPGEVKMTLLFDYDTNYFTSVLIQKAPFLDEKIIKKNISDKIVLIDIEEAYQSTFFQIEYFLRNFIVINFKDKNIFWDFNKPIVESIHAIIKILSQDWDIHKISWIIVELINKMKSSLSGSFWVNISTFQNFEVDGKTFWDITKNLYHPDWINPNGKRFN